jgi:hypothetical protein
MLGLNGTAYWISLVALLAVCGTSAYIRKQRRK